MASESSNNWKSLTMLISHVFCAHDHTRLVISRRPVLSCPPVKLAYKTDLIRVCVAAPTDRQIGMRDRRAGCRRRRRSRDFLVGFTDQSPVSHGRWPLITAQTQPDKRDALTDRQTDSTTSRHSTRVITTHTRPICITMFYSGSSCPVHAVATWQLTSVFASQQTQTQ